MLKVGDIILSNNCAIERKSVETGDLIESLN
jgi:ERCC4-type nuclease